MSLLNKIIQRFKKSTPDSFINKFLKESKVKNVQMELYFNERVLLQIDSLKNVPVWIERGKVNEDNYKNGFILFFFINKRKKEKYNECKRILDTSDLNMIEFEGKLNFIFMHFFDKNVKSIELNAFLRKVINIVYQLPTENTKIGFNLRYLKN